MCMRVHVHIGVSARAVVPACMQFFCVGANVSVCIHESELANAQTYLRASVTA